MDFTPDEELQRQKSFNLAPMVDFLFLLLAVFAVMAATRSTLYDSEVHLVQKESPPIREDLPSNFSHTILLSINKTGQYKWVTDLNEFILSDVQSIKDELTKQQQLGLLPVESGRTKILVHIDRDAHWQAIAELLFAVRDMGFHITPVYEPISK